MTGQSDRRGFLLKGGGVHSLPGGSLGLFLKKEMSHSWREQEAWPSPSVTMDTSFCAEAFVFSLESGGWDYMTLSCHLKWLSRSLFHVCRGRVSGGGTKIQNYEEK
jgi:hypothetical protein